MKRKFVAVLGAILMLMGVMVQPAMVSAVSGATDDYEAGGNCGAPAFLGFRAWFDGLCDKQKNEINLPEGPNQTVTFVWIVAMNVLCDLFVAVGYLSLGFVIYGGYLYIVSQGDPSRAMRGQKTLTSAVIGTVLALLATVIVNTAKIVIGISSNAWKQPEFVQSQIQNGFTWAYTAAGIVAVVFIVRGGVAFLISQGDPAKIQQAKRSIIYAVVGLIIVLLAAVITTFITTSTNGALEDVSAVAGEMEALS